jgi:hypothetical protein
MKMENLFCRAPVMVSLLALLLATSSAKAACGVPEQASEITTKVPFVAQSADEGSTQHRERHHDHDDSILGLWHVAYVNSDGSPFYQSFKFWHADRTEWESASGSPLAGNVCLGVWRETETGTIRLHHVGWTFDSDNKGALTGTLTLDEINTVAPGGETYTGTFVLINYDLSGNVVRQFQGTLTAKRITVDSTGAP